LATSSEHKKRLSRFAIFTVAILLLIGVARVGLYGRGVVLHIMEGEGDPQAEAMKTCESFFADGESDRSDRIHSKDAYPPIPSLVQERQSRCQTWLNRAELIGDEFLPWELALWVVGALIGGATLLVGLLVLRRHTHAGKLMRWLFVAQLVAAVGEIDLAVRQGAQNEDLLLKLWPEIQSQGVGWWLINGPWVVTAGSYVFLCLIYLTLFLMVRAKRMWAV
jgi:hypothetical protein